MTKAVAAGKLSEQPLRGHRCRRLCRRLKIRNATLATAESCTGGLLSHLITQVPGSSDYFKGGITAYSNGLKTGILGVRKKTLQKYGAVSKQCAIEMARGARKLFAADYSISVTGIAGPSGGTDKKPVGLVYFAVAGPDGAACFKKIFRGSRSTIKRLSADFALDMLIKKIE
ncbi:MAG: CinA family protein [Elusimicrobia bacterium]|nr:CinA family protein [Elusimicrobiota bacterium]